MVAFLGETKEKIVDGTALQFNIRQLIHVVTECGRSLETPRVPGDVLARHAHARLDAIEGVQILQVSEENVVDLVDAWRRQVRAGLQKMFDLAEQPGAALRGAREVGFTVLTMSVSLVAVFIPLLPTLG